MIRKQLYITEENERALKRQARQRHTTEASILREALERYFSSRRHTQNPLDKIVGGAHGPADSSINHDHYLYGAPKKRP